MVTLTHPHQGGKGERKRRKIKKKMKELINPKHHENEIKGRAFVKISAGISAVGNQVVEKEPACTWSRRK